ncbi:serine protease inhibitor 28Dc-like isoform X1 [Ochlerotatus camptorhynchus]|uniref:serine protease inhibitor 28Dc-like isoform X1 n=1 Tax=Ochlerotatus camptorhynchus TaxID=644619 RepID=UPI0031D9B084
MRLFASIGIILLVVVLQSHCQQDQDLTIGPTRQNLDLVSRSVTNLAQKISLAIASPKSKTELFSPVSIAGALSLLLLGSGGTTRDELTNLLGFQGQPISFTDIHKSFGRLFEELVSNEPSMMTRIPWRENDKCNNPDEDEEDEPSYQPSKAPSNQENRNKRDADSHFISVANGVFLDSNLHLNPNYENLTKKLYAGEISRKPLLSDPVRSSYEINKWVQQATRNKIREIVSPEQVSNAPMVLASALYFKAKWETMFIEPETRPRPYYINGRESPPIDIYTMTTSGCFPFYEDKQLDVKIVGLPYQEGKTTMYIIMPNKSDRQKIRILQNRVHVGQMNEFIDRMVVKTGTILLPKMKLENTLGLKDVLVSEGLQKIFNPYLSNLTEITKEGRIFETVNRWAQQPHSTSTPMPITRKQTSPKPTPVSAPIQPIHSPDVPPANQLTKVGLKENVCNMINNCVYDGYTCTCFLNSPISTNARGCSKPWNIQRNCPPERQVLKDYGLCLADSYSKYPIGKGQCAQNCEQLTDWCYCCMPPSAAATQPIQQSSISPSSVDNQQSFSPPNTFEVGNRFNPNIVVTPSAPTQLCRYVNRCYQNSYICQIHTICSLANYKVGPAAENSDHRHKRQTQNNSSPPNLYVGDVLHKVTLDINEQGTEGGAVTAVVIDRISSSFNLRVDGPFLIYLRNDITKLPLFYGAVFDPRP